MTPEQKSSCCHAPVLTSVFKICSECHELCEPAMPNPTPSPVPEPPEGFVLKKFDDDAPLPDFYAWAPMAWPDEWHKCRVSGHRAAPGSYFYAIPHPSPSSQPHNPENVAEEKLPTRGYLKGQKDGTAISNNERARFLLVSELDNPPEELYILAKDSWHMVKLVGDLKYRTVCTFAPLPEWAKQPPIIRPTDFKDEGIKTFPELKRLRAAQGGEGYDRGNTDPQQV